MTICKALGTVFDTHILWSAWSFLTAVQKLKLTPVSYFPEYLCKQYCRKISEAATAVLLRSLEGDAVSMRSGPWHFENHWPSDTATHPRRCVASILFMLASDYINREWINSKIRESFIFFTVITWLYCTFSWHAEHIWHNPDFTLLWAPPKNDVKALCQQHTRNCEKSKMWEW